MNNVMEDFLNAELMKGIEGFDPFVENMEDFLDEENFNVEDMCVDNEAEGGEKVQDFLDEETVNLEDICFDNEAEDGENLEDFFDEENMISDVHVDMDDFDISIETDEHVLVNSFLQKGLLPAISQKFPCAEHRFCLKHIYENMRKYWKTREYKDHLWKCATATTIPEFERFMREFSFFDMKAHEWLSKIPAKHWARSHFTGRAVSDMLLNNVCEVFNSKLRNGRDKPIITSLEFIREYLMKRICNVMKVMNKCNGPLTPTATKILDTNIKNASQYTARWNGLHKYQVQGPWHDQHVVDMGQMSCSCRKWELTGIPCRHAIATINEMADNGETVKEMYTYVHKVYWLETWKTAYSFKVDPIKGRSMWPRSECPTVLTPPPHHKVVGRPKKKRKQSEDERKFTQSQKGSQNQSQSQKLTRKFVTVTCGKCKHKGHNSRTCKGQGGVEGTSQGRV
ncbi:hypothetical protein L2E82_45113 [Cichorium intybus]|uniref:Uncharacterized protein n=1 Tax=Cichorium intybus TaxID=13427 RepID=A0ACB8ZS72_CICIN|nr:hypothetical protein L2E82_45113 [Cichorium intybus]